MKSKKENKEICEEEKDSWIKKVIALIAFFIVLFVLGINIVWINDVGLDEESQISFFGFKNIAISVGITIAIVLSSYLLKKIETPKKIRIAVVILLIVLYGLAQVLWIQNTVGTQFADSQTVIITAEEIFKGQEDLTYKNYIQYYPQQLNLALTFTAIFKLFNSTNLEILQYLNVIANVLTILGLYAITFEIGKEIKINKIIFWIISLSFIPVILLSMFVYGDFIGLVFAIWSVFFAIRYKKYKKKRYFLCSAILIMMACFIRMNYLVLVIAIGIYWLIDFLEKQDKDKKDLLKVSISIILLVVITIVPNKIIKKLFCEQYNLNPEKSFSSIIYLYMGMSESTRGSGWYNPEVHEIFTLSMEENSDNKKILEEKLYPQMKERVKFLVTNPIKMIKFYTKKMITMWADPTMEFRFYNSVYPKELNIEDFPIVNNILNLDAYSFIQLYQKALLFLIYGGTIFAIWHQKKKLNKEIIFLCLIFLGGFGFHVLWEAKSRYIIPYVLILIPVASIGISNFIETIERKIKNRKIPRLKGATYEEVEETNIKNMY